MIWLIKEPGLYDTYEPEEQDMSDWFEEEEWEMKCGNYNGWHFRPVR